MITIDELEKSIKEAERFIEKAKAAIEWLKRERLESDQSLAFGSRATGRVRRASMDVTEQLVKLRSYK